MAKYKVGIISLGCDKNRVDTEILLGKLKDKFEITVNPKEADVIIVNTCGFIEKSKQESIDTILEMAEYKNKYKCEVLVATGCLTQRYKGELQELMPEIDIILGVNDYDKLTECIEGFYNKKEKILLCSSDKLINEGERVLSTGQNYTYLRISEGCSNNCTYCAIPKIRGQYRSRKIENIINEANSLVKQGIKEIIIIAQDTTLYGVDIYGKKMLPSLLEKLSQVEGIEWIRLLYCYPEEITDELIETIANNDKICKYVDLPIQHISNNILKRMGRRGTKEKIIQVLSKLRNNVNNIALRTTFIVGFPGETEEDFIELRDFVNDVKFENMGVFKYSPEEGTPAAAMDDQVSDSVKELRERELMKIQQQISLENNLSKIGNVYEVLVEDFDGQYYIGRSQFLAPEIDGLIYINPQEELEKGKIVNVKITKALEYDLIGDVYYEPGE